MLYVCVSVCIYVRMYAIRRACVLYECASDGTERWRALHLAFSADNASSEESERAARARDRLLANETNSGRARDAAAAAAAPREAAGRASR